MKKKPSLKQALAVCALVLLAGAMLLVYSLFGEKAVEGSKAVTLEVVNAQGQSTVYSVKTDAQYLKGVMDEAEGLTYEGTQGAYGLMISSVNGELADYNVNGAYWSIMVNGEYGNYGADQQPVEDGDGFALVYTK